MTIKKKSMVVLGVLGVMVAGMAINGFVTVDKLTSSTDKIVKMDKTIMHNQKIITAHEKYGGGMLKSIAQNTTFGGGLNHKGCILGKWWFKFKKTAEFKELPKAQQKEMIKMEHSHAAIHGYAQEFKDKYKFYDRNLEAIIFQREIDHLNWAAKLTQSVLNNTVTKVSTNNHKCGFGKWYDKYIISDAKKELSPELQKVLDGLYKPHEKLHHSAIDIKQLQSEGKWGEAKKVFELRTLVELKKIQDGMKDLRTILNTYKKNNAEIKQKVEYQLPEKLKTVVGALNGYSKILNAKSEETLSNNESDKNISSILILLTTISVAISLIMIILLNNGIIRKIETFKTGLDSFFKYLNKESIAVNELKVEGNDEIAHMSSIVNDNMKKTVTNIDKEIELLKEVQEVVNEVNNGSLESRVKAQTNTESLNDLRDSLNKMLESLESNVASDLIALEKTIGSYGNLDFTSKVNCKKGKMKDAINNLGDLVTEMLVSSQNVSLELNSNADKLESNMTALASASNEQAASLEEVSASVEEISGNIAQSKDKTSQVAQNAHEMKKLANEGSKDVTKMNEIIENVSESQNKISNAIQQIDQIAFQTNILSLNAAVEAATAGEHGKGFAVVAQEVRNLAARSAEAAEDIKKLVDTSSGLISESTELSSHVSVSFTKLVEAVEDTSTNIDEVYQTGKEQEDGINQISTTMSQLDQNTQENARMANETLTIALSTKESANTILEDMADKEFNGKK